MKFRMFVSTILLSLGMARAVSAESPPAAKTSAEGFAAVIGSLLRPASSPDSSYYDWRFIEAAPGSTWDALPPQMLDQPLADGNYFKRTGSVRFGQQSVKVLAAGARSMVFSIYFRNEAAQVGEQALVGALRKSGYTVVTARCPINRTRPAPIWYRVSGKGRHASLLWISPHISPRANFEGFSLSLDPALKPMTPQDRLIYTDRCH